LAGVSSFGFGGTNCHIILEETPTQNFIGNPIERPHHLLTLSAKNEQALRDLAQKYQDFLTANQQLSLAWQKDNHLVEFKAGYQFIPFEGYANQRMDMTKNIGSQFNLKYTGQYDWGKLEAQAYNQMVNHQMDDNVGARTSPAMPMLTSSSTNGAIIKGTLPISETQLARVGTEWQGYKLNDWWPAAYSTVGMMGPNTFQNINNGTRNRLALFSELEQQWTKEWMSLAGVRVEQVASNAGDVQGYNATSAKYGVDSKAFNAQQHQQHNINIFSCLHIFLTSWSNVNFLWQLSCV
jgi:iron complex outermembrane receptor protein